jgi:hypothetical protein
VPSCEGRENSGAALPTAGIAANAEYIPTPKTNVTRTTIHRRIETPSVK